MTSSARQNARAQGDQSYVGTNSVPMWVRPVCCSVAQRRASKFRISKASFKAGKSTYGDVVAALGPPTSTTTSSNGKRSAVYSYAAVQARPQNFIPYIGPFISGYDTKSSAVTFEFDARGVLTSTSSTQGTAGIGANLAAGSVQPAPITAQPR